MNQKKEAVQKAKEYIEQNLEKKLDLDQISEMAGYSKFHFNRIFLKETGDTVYKYLQKKRLSLAAEKLIQTQKPIAQIALEAGYDSQQAFTLTFKQYYACTPGQFRQKNAIQQKGGMAA